MNTIQKSTKYASSISLELERLQLSYSNVLIKYKQAVADYISTINNRKQNTLVSIKGKAYNGTRIDKPSTANTLQTCIAACSASSTCTGATFVSNKCNLRAGDSPIIPSSSNSYAIVPNGKRLLMNMENLNQQLLNINKNIRNKITAGQPVYNNLQVDNKKKSEQLIKNYKELERERNNIRKLLEQYETLDTIENENQIKITKNYYSYILLFIIAIAVIFLLVNISMPTSSSSSPTIQYGGQLNKNVYYILLAIILLIFTINFLVKYLSV